MKTTAAIMFVIFRVALICFLFTMFSWSPFMQGFVVIVGLQLVGIELLLYLFTGFVMILGAMCPKKEQK